MTKEKDYELPSESELTTQIEEMKCQREIDIDDYLRSVIDELDLSIILKNIMQGITQGRKAELVYLDKTSEIGNKIGVTAYKYASMLSKNLAFLAMQDQLMRTNLFSSIKIKVDSIGRVSLHFFFNEDLNHSMKVTKKEGSQPGFIKRLFLSIGIFPKKVNDEIYAENLVAAFQENTGQLSALAKQLDIPNTEDLTNAVKEVAETLSLTNNRRANVRQLNGHIASAIADFAPFVKHQEHMQSDDKERLSKQYQAIVKNIKDVATLQTNDELQRARDGSDISLIRLENCL